MVFLRSERLKWCSLFSGLILAILVPCVGNSQQGASENPYSDTQSTQADCSDPSLAGSAVCASQASSQSSQNPLQPGVPLGVNAVTPQIPSSYTDNELLARRRAYGALQTRIPEPLTEFQKFAASATGQVLPIFGENLFRDVPSTFAPLDLTPVPSDYVVGPGDELRIRVWGQISFQANVRVDRSGEVYLPHIGPVHVAGLPFSALQGQLNDAIGRVYRNFQLTVDIGQIRAIQVYVTGQARHPGVYTVSSLSTLIDALFASGGPSIQGSLRRIELRRNGKVVTELDLYRFLAGGDKSQDVNLEPGDVLFIPPAGSQVAVTGSVRNPRIYELKPGETVGELLTDAGGASSLASQTQISIGRIAGHQEMSSTDVPFNAAGLTTPLRDGDLVRVTAILPRFQNTVTLRGNTANPGKFGWHQGMRISDLIPDKEALLTRDYWWNRAKLGLPTPEFEADDQLRELHQPTQAQPWPPTGRRTYPCGQYAPFGRSGQYGQSSAAQNGIQGAVQSGCDQNSSTDQYGVEQGYGQQGQTDQQSGAMPQRSASNGTLAAQQEQNNPYDQYGETNYGVGPNSQTGYPRSTPQRPKTEVRFLAPEIDWDYAVIERLNRQTLKTELIPFDLGRVVLQHDSTQDLELEPGDVVTIFSDADIRLPIAQQSKMIRLEGEFNHAGTYMVRPGETLRELVERAGGLTPQAYLYGSEFRRESTRRIQQARMDEYVQNLTMQMERSNLATVSSAVSSAQDLASSSMANTSEQQIVAELRQVRATGRIVLQFRPGSMGDSQIPDIALENGDTFIVPSHPANVNVIGAVYDQNSFLYTPDQTVKKYLHLAGGPNRNADRGREFIIRADGEVVSRDSLSSAPWMSGFENLHLNPGDTIVVPEKVFKPSALRGFLDWSQLFSQFALGAAALSVIQ